jgi:hypothetical protein
MRKLVCLMVVGTLLFAACGTESNETSAPRPSVVSVTASNYKFATATTTVPSGAVSVRLTNKGPEPHQAQLFKLKSGVDAAKIVEASKTGQAEVQKLGVYAGGPDGVDAGETEATVNDLEPGRYVFMCLIPDAKGREHASLGMVKPITVTASADEAAVPQADYTATTKEFSFGFPAKWTGSISVDNIGQQPHEFQIMEIAPGKTPADFEKWFQDNAGPPPWMTGGGPAVIAPGAKAYFEADLKPGTYYLMCFVADPQRKAPHFALGMMQKFEVK